ncbi:hypothetical protein BDP27DRAFT_1320449 [Rhodocollybia butyracea]|uniref:Uncharacterized protein n=1 Tax=Rhodocollybia butyracea TaxID=206335 RepID=A0A9P5U9X2_9AGAR|nr:hypothetical protein BDP27DRAFT_1320449 [Rhodocollybia butyracea]
MRCATVIRRRSYLPSFQAKRCTRYSFLDLALWRIKQRPHLTIIRNLRSANQLLPSWRTSV